MIPVSDGGSKFFQNLINNLDKKETEQVSTQVDLKNMFNAAVGKAGRSITRYLTGDPNNDMVGDITNLTDKEPLYMQNSTDYEEMNKNLIKNMLILDPSSSSEQKLENIKQAYMMALTQCYTKANYIDKKVAPLQDGSEKVYDTVFGNLITSTQNAMNAVQEVVSSIGSVLSTVGGSSSDGGVVGSIVSGVGALSETITSKMKGFANEDKDSKTMRRYIQAANGKELEHLKLSYLLNQVEACDLKIRALSKIYAEAMVKK
jgi:hypothetical protein